MYGLHKIGVLIGNKEHNNNAKTYYMNLIITLSLWLHQDMRILKQYSR